MHDTAATLRAATNNLLQALNYISVEKTILRIIITSNNSYTNNNKTMSAEKKSRGPTDNVCPL